MDDDEAVELIGDKIIPAINYTLLGRIQTVPEFILPIKGGWMFFIGSYKRIMLFKLPLKGDVLLIRRTYHPPWSVDATWEDWLNKECIYDDVRCAKEAQDFKKYQVALRDGFK